MKLRLEHHVPPPDQTPILLPGPSTEATSFRILPYGPPITPSGDRLPAPLARPALIDAHADFDHQLTSLKALLAQATAFRLAITQTKAFEPLAAPGAVTAPAGARYAVLALASRNPRHRSGRQIAGFAASDAAPFRVLERIEGERPRGVILNPTLIRAKPDRVVSPRTTIDVWLAASETCRIGGPNLRLFALLAIFQNSFRKPLNAAHSVLRCSEKRSGRTLQMKRTARCRQRHRPPISVAVVWGEPPRLPILLVGMRKLHVPFYQLI